jgi:glutamate dehydrogenase
MARSLDLIEAARVLERDLADAAQVWFGLDARLGLNWISEATAALPRSRRWESLARSALRDELSHTHSDLAATVLRHVDRVGVPVEDGVATWLAGNASAARRLDSLRAAVASEQSPGLEPLTGAHG